MNVVYKNVLVELPTEDQAGIFVPLEEQKAGRLGRVVRYGESVPDDLKTIFNNKPNVEFKEYYDGSEITIEGKKYIVMTYDSILIIL